MTRLGSAARVLGFVVVAWLLQTAPAYSDSATVQGADAPIVRVQALQGNVTIRTWDRPDVQVDGDPSLYTIDQHVNHIPAVFPPTPISPSRITAPDGTPVDLPAESFVVSTLPPGPRTVVVVKGGLVGDVTVTVPSNSAVVGVQLGLGSLNVDGYRNGTLIAHVRSGSVALRNMSGDAFVQILRGPMTVDDSSFGRLRARSALGPITFERCNVRQIEATDVYGSIVYDRGSFQPGLARFASERGDVAIGVGSGGAQVGASVAGGGRVYTMFDGRAQIDARDGQSSVAVGGGGPTVNATSGSGNVYLYDGSLRTRTHLPPEWQAPQSALPGAAHFGFGAGFGGQSRYLGQPQSRPPAAPYRTPPGYPYGSPPQYQYHGSPPYPYHAPAPQSPQYQYHGTPQYQDRGAPYPYHPAPQAHYHSPPAQQYHTSKPPPQYHPHPPPHH